VNGASKIDTLEVVLTAGCNLRCTYCYQNDKKSRRMEWETLRGALDLLLASRPRKLAVIFLGGEPLLELALIRRAVEHVRAVKRRGKRVSYQLITNGTLLDDEALDFLVENGFDLQVSFDGVREAQALRGAKTFELLDGLLDRLREKRPGYFRERLSVALTLSARAVPHFANSVAYFLRKGIPELLIGPVTTHEPEWRPERITELKEQFERVLASAKRHYRRTGEVPIALFRREGPVDLHAPRRDQMCGAPSGTTLAVDVDGQVHGCAVFTESYQSFPSPFLREKVAALRLGDFRSPEFEDRVRAFPEAARETGIFHGKSRKYSSYGRCGECRFLESCTICPASIGKIPENTDPDRVPDFGCAFNLVALSCRERFPRQPNPVELLTGAVRAYGPLGDLQRRLLGT
jgi:sulfatase maturation enzyme AslB (radical SAM superfamily)